MALLVTEDYCKYVLKFFYEVNEAVHRSKIYKKIKEYSNTSDEDYNIVYQNVKSSNNGYSKFKDKIHWNLTFLKQAELIENVDRGYIK